MFRLGTLYSLLFFVASCVHIQNLDEALRLKEYSDESDARDRMITRYQEQFRELVRRIREGDQLKDMATKADVIARLGDPVLALKDAQTQGERWLYRDPVKYFDTPKVYFFLDSQGRVLRWDSVGIIGEASGDE